MRDGLLDVGERAAPQPVVIVEIGIALGAAAAGAVARRAIVGEGAAAQRAGEVEQLRRRFRSACSEAAASFAIIGPRCACSAARSVATADARMPVEDAVGIGRHQRPGRIDDPIADRPDDGRVEQPQPPARQRRVQLVDAVPFVAGRADAAARASAGFARSCQSSRSGMRADSSNCFWRDGHSA